MAYEIRLDCGPIVTEDVDTRSLVRRKPVRWERADLSATVAHPDTGFATLRDGRRVICL